MDPQHANGPLVGMKVLDLSEGVAGPFCAKLLGDLRALAQICNVGLNDPEKAEQCL